VWSATSQGASRSGGAGANPPTVEEPGVVSPEGRRATGVERARAHGRQARGRDEPRKARQGEWHRRAPQRWVVAAHGIARSQESRGCSHVTLKTGEICRKSTAWKGRGAIREGGAGWWGAWHDGSHDAFCGGARGHTAKNRGAARGACVSRKKGERKSSGREGKEPRGLNPVS
jgi:hypothetical protein